MKSESKQVLLIRHAESEANAGLATRDAGSAALTKRGLRQAEALARGLRESPGRIFVSNMLRSSQTADSIRARFPDLCFEEWPIHEFTYLSNPMYAGTTASERAEASESYWRTAKPWEVNGEGAESFVEFIARVDEAIRRLRQVPDRSVVFVSHQKFLSALLWLLMLRETKVSSRRMARYRRFDQGLRLPNASVVPILWHGDKAWIGEIERMDLDVE